MVETRLRDEAVFGRPVLRVVPAKLHRAVGFRISFCSGGGGRRIG